MTPSPGPGRRGSVYILVLSASLLGTVIGISALMVARIQHRAAAGTDDLAEARVYARSALEIGLLKISQDPTWRTTYGNSNWPKNQPIGNGTYTIEAVDPADGDVTTGSLDPVELTGIGTMGLATQKIKVRLDADPPPLEALNMALHAETQVHVVIGTVTVVGAPLSCNVEILNEGVIYGDAEAGSTITNPGTITGTQMAPVPNKTMPASTVLDMYVGLATPITNPGTISNQLLSPGNNPWGPTDPDGVYFIDTLGGDLSIKGSRIHGTLVVKCGAGTVRLNDAALLHPFRTDYPTLIVDGNLELNLNSADKVLSEAEWATNFNPPATPYKTFGNGTKNDVYPNEVQGLVHVTQNLLMRRSSRVWGTIICESTATCQEDTALIHDPDLYARPPLGYTEPVVNPPMTIASGTWEQSVN